MSGCSLCTAAPAIHHFLYTPIRPATAAAPARLCHGLDGGGACLSFKLVSRKPWKEVRRKQRCSPGSEVSYGFLAEPALEVGFVVVNFYKFVLIEDPGGEVTKHLAFLQGRDVHGRIYINEQGINAQYSGPVADAMAYVEWLKEDDRLSDVLVQISPTLCGHAFPRLKLRCKPSLVQLEGGISHLPLLDPTMRATPLEPSKWRKKILCIPSFDDSLGCDQSKTDHNLLLLDVRNGTTWQIMISGPDNVKGFFIQWMLSVLLIAWRSSSMVRVLGVLGHILILCTLLGYKGICLFVAQAFKILFTGDHFTKFREDEFGMIGMYNKYAVSEQWKSIRKLLELKIE